MTCSGAATSGPGTRTASGAVAIKGMTCSGAAQFRQYSATAAVSIAPMTSAGSALFLQYYGIGNAIIAPMVSSGSASFGPGDPRLGEAAVTIGAMTCSAHAIYGPPVILDIGTNAWIGRYRRGERLPLAFATALTPGECPTVDFWHECTTKVKTIQLPSHDALHKLFAKNQFLDSSFVDGHYVATVRYTLIGAPNYSFRTFEVIGGDPSGAAIAITEMRRPLGRAIITQREDGRIAMGYNPRVTQ